MQWPLGWWAENMNSGPGVHDFTERKTRVPPCGAQPMMECDLVFTAHPLKLDRGSVKKCIDAVIDHTTPNMKRALSTGEWYLDLDCVRLSVGRTGDAFEVDPRAAETGGEAAVTGFTHLLTHVQTNGHPRGQTTLLTNHV